MSRLLQAIPAVFLIASLSTGCGEEGAGDAGVPICTALLNGQFEKADDLIDGLSEEQKEKVETVGSFDDFDYAFGRLAYVLTSAGDGYRGIPSVNLGGRDGFIQDEVDRLTLAWNGCDALTGGEFPSVDGAEFERMNSKVAYEAGLIYDEDNAPMGQ